MAEGGTTTRHLTGQYLSFSLDSELFAIGVAGIREIIDYTDTTRIPRMPDYMRGVTNLRGSVVPVIDLRMKFGLGRVERTIDTCIVVLEIPVEDETTTIGALVDSVREVFELDAAAIEPPPRIGGKLDTGFMLGMGRVGEQFVILLDPARVFASEELQEMRSAAEGVREADAKIVTA